MPRAKVTKKAGKVTKKKTTPRKVTAKSTTAANKKAPAKRAKTTRTRKTRESEIVIAADERRCRIAEVAYLRAEARGFIGGDPTSDWLEAESEIDARALHL